MKMEHTVFRNVGI